MEHFRAFMVKTTWLGSASAEATLSGTHGSRRRRLVEHLAFGQESGLAPPACSATVDLPLGVRPGTNSVRHPVSITANSRFSTMVVVYTRGMHLAQLRKRIDVRYNAGSGKLPPCCWAQMALH